MKTVVLEQNEIYTGSLILVNAEYPLRSTPTDLAPAVTGFADISMERCAAEQLQLILDKIGAGNMISPVSGYRSKAEQTAIYENSMKENGDDFTQKYVALPDHSEHQTGLAIDLALNTDNIDFIRPDFPYSGICEKFRKAVPEFGFIERYPKGKENITGIAHEPWHFRYVGFPHSTIISEKEITLEEYTEYIKTFRQDCPLRYIHNGITAEIFYAPAETEISVNSAAYQVSGNNTDGFVVTQWRVNNA